MSVKSTYRQAAHPEHEVDEHTGRFDTGEELEPEKDRELTGRFDSGEELEPAKDREQDGRFDTCDEPSN
jgi:hypothetical protein